MDLIPAELKARKQWITWRHGPNGEKIPNGKSNDPATWCEFDEIKDFDKIAFVFSGDDPYVGIDLDNCVCDDGTYNETASYALNLFAGKAYCDVSYSQKGLHFIVRGKKPDWACCKRGDVECYDHARFWIMTGQTDESWSKIGDAQAELEEFLSKYLKKNTSPVVKAVSPVKMFSDIETRISDYVLGCAPASEGSRNQSGFSISGHLWAIRGDNGLEPTADQVFFGLSLWNAKNNPPLEEEELRKLVSNGKKNGTPRQQKIGMQIDSQLQTLGKSISDSLIAEFDAKKGETDDDDFCDSMVPKHGLLREIYDFYLDLAIRPSPVMGLAVSVVLMQTILGRKVRSHTDLRTNDYHLVLAATASGKEACKSCCVKILSAAGADHLLMAADVQSGNGLITAVSQQPCSLWVSDEFGKVLQAILDKRGNQHLKNIGKHLLTFYGESSGKFLGAAHAAGAKNEIDQPHLCVLGLSTGSTIFAGLDATSVSDGLINRIAFWPVQHRPILKDDYELPKVPESLISGIKSWVAFDPNTCQGNWDASSISFSDFRPNPSVIRPSEEAKCIWRNHCKKIDEKMERETGQRSALWGRTAARSLSLGMVHRCSRMQFPYESPISEIEREDIEWGIKLSVWLSRIACDLVEENMVDRDLERAKAILVASTASGKVAARDVLRKCRSLTAGDLDAAATRAGLQIITETGKGRPKKFYARSAAV